MRVYKPAGRTIWRVKLPLREGGWSVCSSGTRDQNIAEKMEQMVKELGPRELRAWDVLEAVTSTPARLTLAELWDHWVGVGRDLKTLRERLDDANLAPRIDAWLATVRLRASDETASHYKVAVMALCDESGRILRSTLTTERIRTWLSGLTMVRGKKEVPLSTGTARRYYAGLSSFFAYLRSIKVLTFDPLADVPTPKAGSPRDRHLETPEAKALADYCEGPYRTINALMPATGIEMSVTL